MRNPPKTYDELLKRIESVKDEIKDIEYQIDDLESDKSSKECDLLDLEDMITTLAPPEIVAKLEADEEAEQEEARQKELLYMAYRGYPRIPDNISDYWQRV